MKQNNKLSGQPLICQLFSFIPDEIIKKAVENFNSDYYYKTLTTKKQLIFLLYGVITQSNSLNALCKSLLFLENKLTYIGIDKLPAVSTLSDANINRSSEVFGHIYNQLYQHYKNDLSDSLIGPFINGEADPSYIEAFDATTISLFTDVFQNSGRKPLEGKRKGGLKIQAKLPFSSPVPDFITLKEASSNDKNLLGQLEGEAGKIYVFDKGYENHNKFREWSQQNIGFVTPLRANAIYEVISGKIYEPEEYNQGGVMKDQVIQLPNGLNLRLVTYVSPVTGQILYFLTNKMNYEPLTIALIYKYRWSIEVLFKQIKQNFQLLYFFSDSREGIKSQIWVTLIANLLFSVIHRQIKEAELFTTIVAIASNNLGSYVCFISLLKTKKLNEKERNLENIQITLFDTS